MALGLLLVRTFFSLVGVIGSDRGDHLHFRILLLPTFFLFRLVPKVDVLRKSGSGCLVILVYVKEALQSRGS